MDMTTGLRFTKPAKGTALLERETKKARRKALEQLVAKLVKRRDGRCRWPEKHICRGGLEAAHLDGKGMGGDHGLRTYAENEVTLCAWLHRRGPESLHGGQLRIDKDTAAGANGPLSFWRQTETGWHLVAREVAPFSYEKD